MPSKVCNECGKTVSRTPGSLTSFFFQYNSCDCQTGTPSASKQSEIGNSICKTCGKYRPKTNHAGSFTSFLFKELRCSCNGQTAAEASASPALNAGLRTDTSSRFRQRKQLTLSRIEDQNDSSNSLRKTVFSERSVVGNTFRIHSQIGQGGMGTVYLVDHISLGRQFALKILDPDLVNKQNWLRFEAEAKTMASLNHRTFVRVYDLGIHLGSIPFYSMDYLSGRTLEAMLGEDGPLEASQALDIFIEVLDGIAYAHRNGIIHRDIKPGNIMICNSESKLVVKILDFGISKLIGSNTKDPQDLTAIGEIFGSPYYMSPEQCSGGAVDGRSDIYSLGCSLFEVLTGFVPFEGASFVETVMMHQEHDPPELSKILPHKRFSHSIELVVTKCLAKLPQDRYQSAKEMSIDLARIKEGKDLSDYYDNTIQNKLTGYHGNNNDSSKINKRIGASLAFVSFVFAALAALFVLPKSLWQASSDKPAALQALTAAEKSKTAPAPMPTNAPTDPGRNRLSLDMLSAFAPKEIDSLSPKQIREVESLLNLNDHYYSHEEKRNGETVCVFNFPIEFSLGRISYSPPGKTSASKFSKAQGIIVAASLPKIQLNFNPQLTAYPKLLYLFRENELAAVNIDERSADINSILPYVQKQKYLARLDLKNSQITDGDLPLIEKLDSLQALEMDAHLISASVLAKSKFLPRLKSLGINKITTATPVLNNLVVSNHLEELSLNQAALTKDDLDVISRLSNLRSLSLRDTVIDDNDLSKLISLRHLENLNLKMCNRLTKSSIDTICKMKSLKFLFLPEELISITNGAALHKAIPKLQEK